MTVSIPLGCHCRVIVLSPTATWACARGTPSSPSSSDSCSPRQPPHRNPDLLSSLVNWLNKP